MRLGASRDGAIWTDVGERSRRSGRVGRGTAVGKLARTRATLQSRLFAVAVRRHNNLKGAATRPPLSRARTVHSNCPTCFPYTSSQKPNPVDPKPASHKHRRRDLLHKLLKHEHVVECRRERDRDRAAFPPTSRRRGHRVALVRKDGRRRGREPLRRRVRRAFLVVATTGGGASHSSGGERDGARVAVVRCEWTCHAHSGRRTGRGKRGRRGLPSHCAPRRGEESVALGSWRRWRARRQVRAVR